MGPVDDSVTTKTKSQSHKGPAVINTHTLARWDSERKIRHIEQMVVNTHKPSADFPTISEYFGPPNRNMNGNFIPENSSYNIPPRTHDADKTKTYLQIDPGHKITKNNGYIILATTRTPTPRIASILMNLEHRGQLDKFVSNDEIIEFLSYNGHNPQTNRQLGNDVGSTDTISCPRYSNSTHQQYIRISRQAWNIFLKCYLCLHPKTDKTITIDFHDTWDALVKKKNNTLRNRSGIGYHTNPTRPTGLEWNCIGKVLTLTAHIHTSIKLQKLIQSKTVEWAITEDWTDQHIELSQPEQGSQWLDVYSWVGTWVGRKPSTHHLLIILE
jgi:hypothetical protein